MTESVEHPHPSTPLARWVKKLSEEEMPVFAQTVSEINRILGSEEFSSLSLARVILQDPTMTAKVLKLANSAFYNPGHAAVSTISRAVVVLGFNAVQAICISIAVVESLLRGAAKERIQLELARSIHAATQARSLALTLKDQASEEIFIAALLLNLGQMAFWCFAGDEGRDLDVALSLSNDPDPSEVEKRVVGFKLMHLTAALAQEWKLTPLVDETLKGKTSNSQRGRCIELGHRIARESENGWASPGMKIVAADVAKFLGKPVDEVDVALQSMAKEAVNTAKTMGAVAAAQMIPVAGPAEIPAVPDKESTDPWMRPDPVLQLKILREITATMIAKPDITVVLEMALEGLHRGVGMDRTVLALVAPRRSVVKAKFVLGCDRIKLMERFQFELGAKPQNLFSYLMDKPQSLWISDYAAPQWAGLMFGPVFESIDRCMFFAEPVVFAGQTIGLFYADRHPSGRELDHEAFEGFKMFVHQANLGLEHVARERIAAAGPR